MTANTTLFSKTCSEDQQHYPTLQKKHKMGPSVRRKKSSSLYGRPEDLKGHDVTTREHKSSHKTTREIVEKTIPARMEKESSGEWRNNGWNQIKESRAEKTEREC